MPYFTGLEFKRFLWQLQWCQTAWFIRCGLKVASMRQLELWLCLLVSFGGLLVLLLRIFGFVRGGAMKIKNRPNNRLVRTPETTRHVS